jgi:hypothetical protein
VVFVVARALLLVDGTLVFLRGRSRFGATGALRFVTLGTLRSLRGSARRATGCGPGMVGVGCDCRNASQDESAGAQHGSGCHLPAGPAV